MMYYEKTYVFYKLGHYIACVVLCTIIKRQESQRMQIVFVYNYEFEQNSNSYSPILTEHCLHMCSLLFIMASKDNINMANNIYVYSKGS